MKNYPQIASKLYGEPWLITKAKHESLTSLFEAHLESNEFVAVNYKEDEETGELKPEVRGKNLILPIHGVLGKHLSFLERFCGGFDVNTLSKWLDYADASWQVERVILDIRSPGGTVTGIPEAAAKISGLSKDVLAFTDSECCSGALYLASQADEFFATESAQVGSVGVYSVFTDRTKQLDELGIKVNAISAGKFKLAGAPFKTMTDDERKMFQERVDNIHRKFKAAVVSVRQVDEQYLQGQVFDGEEAAEIGMTSGTVDDIEDLMR
jgi:signal peptide peptidase SppA